jgi:5-methylcytosine-specific restriction endonuclease McrA
MPLPDWFGMHRKQLPAQKRVGPSSRNAAGKIKRERGPVKVDQDSRCEACGWRPSQSFRSTFKKWVGMMHVHHVVPQACRGTNETENLIILCPTCHAMIHKMTRIGRVGKHRMWFGPSSREETIEALRNARNDE